MGLYVRALDFLPNLGGYPRLFVHSMETLIDRGGMFLAVCLVGGRMDLMLNITVHISS